MRLRQRIGNYFLNKELEGLKRVTMSVPLNDVKRVGVLFSGQDDVSLKAVNLFVERLRKSGKSVRCMGYVSREKAAETLRPAWGLEFFTQNDLNWYFRPESRNVQSFIEEPFDLLIDLRMQRSMALPFVVALSKARFKVGCFNESDHGLYDLMIRADSNMEIAEFIGQLEHYLEMVGPKKDGKQ